VIAGADSEQAIQATTAWRTWVRHGARGSTAMKTRRTTCALASVSNSM
jgi:hypothetical protein